MFPTNNNNIAYPACSACICMHCLPHAMLQITLECSFHLSMSPAIFLNMSESSLVLNCLTSISFLMFPSTISLCNFTGNVILSLFATGVSNP